MPILQNNNTSYPLVPKTSQATVFLTIFTVPSLHSFLFEWPSNQIKFFKKAVGYYTNYCSVTMIKYHDQRQPKKEFALACDSAGLDVPNSDESTVAGVGT